MNIFHKTEVQTVILKFKSYETHAKKHKKCKKWKKHKTNNNALIETNGKGNIWVLNQLRYRPVQHRSISDLICAAPQNDRLNFSFVEDILVVLKNG